MKKIICLFLATFLIGGIAFAKVAGTDIDNAIIYASPGALATEPATTIKLVRYGLVSPNCPTLSSGDVVQWDTNSADGITISACIVDTGGNFAGVLVSTIATADSSKVSTADKNWGYIAIKGFCNAKVDTSEAVSGGNLRLNGATLGSSFSAGGVGKGLEASMSADIGILLTDTGADGLMPVMLK